MANLTEEQLIQKLTTLASSKLARRIEDGGFDVTLEGDRIYIGHEVQSGGRLLRIESYHIPTLVKKVLSRIDLSDGLQPGEIRDAIKAAIPNRKLKLLLDELVP
jgi:hypothetical protein